MLLGSGFGKIAASVLHGFLYVVQSKTLVFLSTCKQVRFVYDAFCKLRPGVSLRHLHGKMKQYKRMVIFNDFNEVRYSHLHLPCPATFLWASFNLFGDKLIFAIFVLLSAATTATAPLPSPTHPARPPLGKQAGMCLLPVYVHRSVLGSARFKGHGFSLRRDFG